MIANRKEFVSKWASLCATTSGRISYGAMLDVLGKDYPKASWLDESDEKGHITTFFNEISIPFKADENYLFFP